MGGLGGSCQYGYPQSSGENEPGIYTAWVDGRSDWCDLYLQSSSDGVYPFTYIDTIQLADGNETNVDMTVERDPTAIENVIVQVEFIGQPAPEGEFYLSLSRQSGGYLSVGGDLDASLQMTVDQMLPGVYRVEVLERDPDGYKGWGDRFVGSPEFVAITAGNQTITLQVLNDGNTVPENTVPVTIIGRTSDGGALQHPVNALIRNENGQTLWWGFESPGPEVANLPAGTYVLDIEPSNLYRGLTGLTFTVSDSGAPQEVVFELTPIRAIPVGPATASLGQTQGPAGTSVPVLGSGFSAREAVTVRWSDGTVLASGLTSANGGLDIAVAIPVADAGSYRIEVVGSLSGTVSAGEFVVTVPFMNVLAVTAVCEGNVDMTLDTDYVGQAFIKLYANNGGDPVRIFDVNGSGTYTVFFAKFTSGDPQYSILPATYQISFGQNGDVAATNGTGVIDIDCSLPEVPPTPTEAPTELPPLEIDHVVLACDGVVTFRVTDVRAIRDGDKAQVTLFAGAFGHDGRIVALIPGEAVYMVQLASSETWPEGYWMRAQVSWAPETQANDVLEPGACDVVTPTVPATVTPTATVPATETPTMPATETPTIPPTEEPAGEQPLIIHFDLPGDADISGAPYQVFAPIAAQFLPEPIQTGVVGSNNTIVVNNVLPGKYRLVVTPEGMAPIEAVITIGDAAVTEVLIEVNAAGEVIVHYLDAVTPTAAPTDPSTPDDGKEGDQEVTGLPSTGGGRASGHLAPMVAMIAAAAVLALVIPAGIMRPVRRKR